MIPTPLTKEKVIIGRIHEGSAFDSQLPVIAEYNVQSAVERLRERIAYRMSIVKSYPVDHEFIQTAVRNLVRDIEIDVDESFPVFVDEDKKQ